MNKRSLPKLLGQVIAGSLSEGFVVRLNPKMDLETVKTGKFVSIYGQNYKFFSLITDVKLEVTNNDILIFPPSDEENLLKETLKLKDIYATALIKPMVALDTRKKISPVKMIPNHFAQVYEADELDIAYVFGDEKDASRKYFNVGNPIDMQAPVCIDLEKLTERSNGIFGKTGTGKTFLTRLVLAGLIKNEKAVSIIFDMHSEYGLQARKEDSTNFVKGLKTLFSDKVAIFSLDPASTRRRGGSADFEIKLSYRSINVDDIISLHHELNLHPTACEAAYLIASKYKRDWLSMLLSQHDRLKDFAQEVGAHPESISALYRKLKNIERLPFFYNDTQKNDQDVIDHMMEYVNRGISIIIEFGNFSSTFSYLLIANIITRRIHSIYMQKTEQFLGSHNKADEPKRLMIVVEEAHKFLNPSAAKQTIFGTIAREMRKYYVSLLVVDQRPSGIDAEVLSQLGTKIIAQLNDESDISAVLYGASNGNYLRNILASLDTKKQVMIIGHAISMPVIIETREYNQDFYQAMQQEDGAKILNAKELIDEIYGT